MSFCNSPTVLGFFSPIFVSLCLSVWEVSVDLSSSSLIMSLAMSGLRMSPLEASVSFTDLVASGPSVCPCVASTVSTRVLGVVILVV